MPALLLVPQPTLVTLAVMYVFTTCRVMLENIRRKSRRERENKKNSREERKPGMLLDEICDLSKRKFNICLLSFFQSLPEFE